MREKTIMEFHNVEFRECDWCCNNHKNCKNSDDVPFRECDWCHAHHNSWIIRKVSDKVTIAQLVPGLKKLFQQLKWWVKMMKLIFRECDACCIHHYNKNNNHPKVQTYVDCNFCHAFHCEKHIKVISKNMDEVNMRKLIAAFERLSLS